MMKIFLDGRLVRVTVEEDEYETQIVAPSIRVVVGSGTHDFELPVTREQASGLTELVGKSVVIALAVGE